MGGIPLAVAGPAGATIGIISGVSVLSAIYATAVPGKILMGIAIGGVVLPEIAGAVLGVSLAGAIGLGVGLASGVAVAGGITLHQFLKYNHETGLSAGEKIFEKIRCHSKFKSCGKNIIVPEGKKCPGSAARASKGRTPA